VSESYVRVPPDSTGKKLRALRETVEGQEVLSETVVLLGKNYTTKALEIVRVEDGKLVVKVG